MSAEPVVVYTSDSLHQANTLAMLLKSEGIEAFVYNADLNIFHGPFSTGWTAPRVAVPADQVAKAAELIREFEAKQLAKPPALSLLNQDAASRDEDEKHFDEEQTLDGHIWPSCPECSARRPAHCPYCKHSGDDFQPAHGIDRTAEFVVVCPTCDEPFAPEFFRLCHKCDHDFGDGKLALKQEPSDEPTDLNWRVLIVVGGTLLSVGGILAYFYFLLAPRQ